MSMVTESLYASKPGTNNSKHPRNAVEELKLKSMHSLQNIGSESTLVKPILSPQVAQFKKSSTLLLSPTI